MNKEWFIFKGTHHLGPFSLEEMEEFFTVGEISAQSLVWREGAEKWEALAKTRELAFLINKNPKKPALPDTTAAPKLPDLPPMDDDVPPPMPPQFLHTEIEDDGSDEPPPIPLDALLNPTGQKRNFKNNPKIENKHSAKIIFGSLVVVFALVLGWFFMNEKTSLIQIRVKGIMPIYLEQLQETAAQKTPSISLALALSLDGKTLFASTNKDGEILSIIKLTSLPKRVLGTEDVEIRVRGIMKNHLGEFGKMQLTKGSKFLPGEYSVEFSGRRLNFFNKTFKFLNDYEMFKQLNTDYKYTSTALIYAGTPREFEKKLLEHQDNIVNERLKPFTDKLERLQTFQSLLNKTVENYLLVLEKIQKPKDIAQFENLYIKEISPIISSLVVAASDLAKKQEGDGTDTRGNVASYESQVLLGKQIGEMASDMITETGKLKKVTSADKTMLKNKFEGRYKFIKSQVDSHLILLQDKINKLVN